MVGGNPRAAIDAVLSDPSSASPELRPIVAALTKRFGSRGLAAYAGDAATFLEPGAVSAAIENSPASIRRELMLQGAERQVQIVADMNSIPFGDPVPVAKSQVLDEEIQKLAGKSQVDWQRMIDTRTIRGDDAAIKEFGLENAVIEKLKQTYPGYAKRIQAAKLDEAEASLVTTGHAFDAWSLDTSRSKFGDGITTILQGLGKQVNADMGNYMQVGYNTVLGTPAAPKKQATNDDQRDLNMLMYGALIDIRDNTRGSVKR
jgi:hypothetical protein